MEGQLDVGSRGRIDVDVRSRCLASVHDRRLHYRHRIKSIPVELEHSETARPQIGGSSPSHCGSGGVASLRKRDPEPIRVLRITTRAVSGLLEQCDALFVTGCKSGEAAIRSGIAGTRCAGRCVGRLGTRHLSELCARLGQTQPVATTLGMKLGRSSKPLSGTPPVPGNRRTASIGCIQARQIDSHDKRHRDDEARSGTEQRPVA
jgi:hypothetical protein